MKQIEAGCKCVIVNSLVGNNGEKVTAVECLGKEIYDDGNFYVSWVISKSLKDTRGGHDRKCPDWQLQRIDDDTTTWEQVAETCYFVPDKLKQTAEG